MGCRRARFGVIYGMDPTTIRTRTLLGIIGAAVASAAVLRHVAHVNVGLTREAIRAQSLGAAAIIASLIAVEFFCRKLRR
jgi:hypothetical protein